MSNQRLTIVRLQKQQRSLQADPIPNLLVKRKNFLNFHFCIYGLDGPYTGGFYHGVLELAADYPFSPPALKFYTESGRFQTNKPICTSFTDFHKEQWTSAWNVRTMLLGVISFMTSPEGGSGSLHESQSKKRSLAQKSLARNMQSTLFLELFGDQIKNLTKNSKLFAKKEQKIQPSNIPSQVQVPQASNAIYGLLGILIILLVSYLMFGNEIKQWVGDN